MPARKPRPDEKPQFERFLETARQLGAGETDEALNQAIRKMAPGQARKAPADPVGNPTRSRQQEP